MFFIVAINFDVFILLYYHHRPHRHFYRRPSSLSPSYFFVCKLQHTVITVTDRIFANVFVMRFLFFSFSFSFLFSCFFFISLGIILFLFFNSARREKCRNGTVTKGEECKESRRDCGGKVKYDATGMNFNAKYYIIRQKYVICRSFMKFNYLISTKMLKQSLFIFFFRHFAIESRLCENVLENQIS